MKITHHDAEPHQSDNVLVGDYRRRKFWLAFGIMAAGMIVAQAWVMWQGWVLHRSYPYNTILYSPEQRFSDLTQVIDSAMQPCPYENQARAAYLPSAYFALQWLGGLNPRTAIHLFLFVTSAGLWLTLSFVLQPLFATTDKVLHSWFKAMLAATGLMAFSFPVWISIDRANIEFLMALLTALSLLCFSRRRFKLGVAFLLPPICFKLYPILLMVLFLRPRHLMRIFIAGALFISINLACLATFTHTMQENWQMRQANLAFCKSFYLINNGSLASSASPWTTCKAVVATGLYALSGFPANVRIILQPGFTEKLYQVYSIGILLFLALGVAYFVLVEKEFFRHSIALLLMMTLAVPYGGDYRLMYINIAMVILILLRSRRRHDLWIVGLLAFATVPKREIYLNYLGVSDSGYYDITVGVFLNAPCALAALWLLVQDGWPDRPWIRARDKIVHNFNVLAYSWKRRFSHA